MKTFPNIHYKISKSVFLYDFGISFFLSFKNLFSFYGFREGICQFLQLFTYNCKILSLSLSLSLSHTHTHTQMWDSSSSSSLDTVMASASTVSTLFIIFNHMCICTVYSSKISWISEVIGRKIGKS